MGRDSLQTLSSIGVAALAALGGVHLSTARRWKRSGKCPRSVVLLVRVCHCGELDPIHSSWRGWRVVRDQLVSPEGWQFTPGAVRSIPLLQRHLAEARRAQRFIAQADWIAGRYATPAAEGSGSGD